jgi:serine/threonine-protein kinase
VAAWLRETKEAGTLPDIDASLRILDATCRGTQAIHDAKTVHCDLKPSNLLLDVDLRVRVADLGLADLMRDLLSSRKHERAGTTAYMAPEIEQEAEVAPDLVARADVYSLGCIAYELLTGYVPFEGPMKLAALLERAVTTPLAPSTLRPDLDLAFDDVILRALAAHPAERTPSAEAFRRELVAARDGTSEPARILVADDDRDFREVLVELLRHEFPRAEIEAVEDGVQALAAFDARRHSVAIVDLAMPKLDGLELTGHLRARATASRVPIIILTASGGPAEWKRLASLGADGFLVKPVDMADVVSLVRRTLRQRSRSVRPPAVA